METRGRTTATGRREVGQLSVLTRFHTLDTTNTTAITTITGTLRHRLNVDAPAPRPVTGTRTVGPSASPVAAAIDRHQGAGTQIPPTDLLSETIPNDPLVPTVNVPHVVYPPPRTFPHCHLAAVPPLKSLVTVLFHIGGASGLNLQIGGRDAKRHRGDILLQGTTDDIAPRPWKIEKEPASAKTKLGAAVTVTVTYGTHIQNLLVGNAPPP